MLVIYHNSPRTLSLRNNGQVYNQWQRHWPRYWFKNDTDMLFSPYLHIYPSWKNFLLRVQDAFLSMHFSLCIPLNTRDNGIHNYHEIGAEEKKWNGTHYLLQIIVFENDIFLFVKFSYNSITREIAICFYFFHISLFSLYLKNTMKDDNNNNLLLTSFTIVLSFVTKQSIHFTHKTL